MKNWYFMIFFLLCTLVLYPVSAFADPVVLYTDIISGPNTGGEDNKGIYLSIFGTGFETTQGSSTVKINNVEVGAYKYWGGAVYGLSHIQQITIQPGSSVTSGAIKVTVGGIDSNTDHSFTVRSGDIYFVDNVACDGTGTINDINDPFCYAESDVHDRGDFGAGDTIVVREGTYTETGNYDAWMTVKKSGTAADPIMILGYPGETPQVQLQHAKGTDKGVTCYSGCDGHLVVAGIDFDSNSGNDSVINDFRTTSRLVNNKIQNMDGRSSGSGGAAGSWTNSYILGNYFYNNGSTAASWSTAKLYHSIYISGGGHSDVEIAWNTININSGGNGIQIYTGSSGTFNNFSIHDNLIFTVGKSGIALGSTCTGDWEIYNNIIYDTDNRVEANEAALSLKGDANFSPNVYNNTIYDYGYNGVLVGTTKTDAEFKNNIIYATITAGVYLSGAASITVDSNLWYGDGTAPAQDSNAINSDPLFVNAGSADFHLLSNSPTIGKGITLNTVLRDFEGVSRPSKNRSNNDEGYELGAYEFDYNIRISSPKNLRIVSISP